MSTEQYRSALVGVSAILAGAVGMLLMSQAGAAPRKTYKAVLVPMAVTRLEKELNAIADDGWELLQLQGVGSSSDAIAVFVK